MFFFCLLASLATAAEPSEVIRLPVRVHMVASTLPQLDSSETPVPEVRARFQEINRAFAAAGIVWEIEAVVVDRPRAETAYRSAQANEERRKMALGAVRATPNRLAPSGFDLYIVQELGPLGIGGAYQCAAGEPAGHGAAFVGSRGKSGRALPTRKWAHELGHALGLSHTPCESANSQRLMMSGKCELAQANRVGFTDREVEILRAQAATGHAAPCKNKKKRSGN